jgi:hypothetical protein
VSISPFLEPQPPSSDTAASDSVGDKTSLKNARILIDFLIQEVGSYGIFRETQGIDARKIEMEILGNARVSPTDNKTIEKTPDGVQKNFKIPPGTTPYEVAEALKRHIYSLNVFKHTYKKVLGVGQIGVPLELAIVIIQKAIPAEHFQMLNELCALLKLVDNKKKFNHMPFPNLALQWLPHLIVKCSAKDTNKGLRAIQLMLENQDQIFKR